MGHKRFPLFVDLTGRAAVVIGGGTVGLRRAEALRRFGALVTVISPSLAREVEGIHYIARGYMPGDLSGAWLAVAAADDPAVNEAAGREARQLGILFNRADDPAGCDFFFPAICVGSGLVAGVTGDGSDHKKTARAAKEIRKILESSEDGILYEASHREQRQHVSGDPGPAGDGRPSGGPSGDGTGAGDHEDHRGQNPGPHLG